MSSLRNAVQRRNHKERSQPSTRQQKWGLLEKHKDYSLRAADYNAKKKKLSILTQKTREKHPDEFAFGMLSEGRGTQGKHGRGDQTKNQLSHDVVRLLKGQDQGYLRTVGNRERREVERVRQAVLLDGVMKGKIGDVKVEKILFDAEGQRIKQGTKRKAEEMDEDLDADTDMDEDDDGADFVTSEEEQGEELLEDHNEDIAIVNGQDDTDSETEQPKQKSRKQIQAEEAAIKQRQTDRKRRKRLREMRAAKLETLKKRQKEIMAAAGELELQRAKMNHTIGGTNKNGVKFKIRERKR